MTKYCLYETSYFKDEKARILIKTWESMPDTKEVNEELKKLSDKHLKHELYYVRAWDPDDSHTKTIFDFGHHVIFAEIEPSMYDAYLNTNPFGS